ncbi:hypothetical protein Ahy_A09g043189 [Arachis hypogaea]|uniref:Uncharacterized protein n=1 Tax=Arachis hypogaea TaxID=3818 RepID=A0A445BHR0_ARAHY|nr:hypothetical protein Ahy_A09g043189 [Arachis hypogaea]
MGCDMFYSNCVFLMYYFKNSLYLGIFILPYSNGSLERNYCCKVDTKGVAHDTFYDTFRVRRICDYPTLIAMFELLDYDADDESTPKKEPDLHKSIPCGKGDIDIKKESTKNFIKSDKPAISGGIEFAALINGEHGKDEKTPSNNTVSDYLSTELDILLSSPEKETQEVLSHVLDAPSQYEEKLIHENHVVNTKGKRNLNPQIEEAATNADGHGFKIAKVLDSSMPALFSNDYLVEVSQNVNQSSNLILSGCFDVGDLNYEYSSCGVCFWLLEHVERDSIVNHPIFTVCCSKGKIQLPYL